MNRRISAVLLFFLVILFQAAHAQEQLDDILDGFEDDSAEVVEVPEDTGPQPDGTDKPFNLNGHLKLCAGYNFAHDAPEPGRTDHRGWSGLEGELRLELSADFPGSWEAFAAAKGSYDAVYGIRGRDRYTSDVLNNDETELDLMDAWIRCTPMNDLDIKFGRQIVVWGKSDNIRVTDVLNPLDIREPGLTDIEDLRLPVAMTRLDYYTGPWSVTAAFVHEIRFNTIPEYGSDFFPSTSPPPDEDTPGNRLENTEIGLAVSGIFSGWDLAFYYAKIFNDLPHLELPAGGLEVKRKHARLDMVGLAFNLAHGSWLFKTEAAMFAGLRSFHSNTDHNRFDVLAGVEYTGFSETTISLEAVNRHLDDYDEVLESYPDKTKKDSFQSALRMERGFLNDTLNLTLLAAVYGISGEDGAFQRLSADYDLADAVEIKGGVVLYQSGDLVAFRNIGDNDRLFLELKYSF